MAFKKYFYYHPESDSLWGQVEPFDLEKSDGLVEEISFEQYLEIEKQLGKPSMIPDQVDLRAIQPKQGGAAHPPGIHDFQITNTFLQENSEKTGAMLVIEFTSPVGSILNRYNVIHPNPDTVRISNEQLSALGHAINIFQISYPKNPDGSPNMQMAGSSLRGGRGKMEITPQMVKNAEGKMVENGFMRLNKVFDVNGNDPCKPGGAPVASGGASSGGWGNNNSNPPQQNQPNQNPPQQQAGWANAGGAQQQPAPNAAPAGGKPSWA